MTSHSSEQTLYRLSYRRWYKYFFNHAQPIELPRLAFSYRKYKVTEAELSKFSTFLAPHCVLYNKLLWPLGGVETLAYQQQTLMHRKSCLITIAIWGLATTNQPWSLYSNRPQKIWKVLHTPQEEYYTECMWKWAEAIRTTIVPISILIRTTVVPIRILIRMTGMCLTICVAWLNFVLHLLWLIFVIHVENYLL